MNHTMLSDIANQIAQAQEKEITSQLNELISRGLLVVETVGPTLVQDKLAHTLGYVSVKMAVKLKLKEQEYIEKLEKENKEMRELIKRMKEYL